MVDPVGYSCRVAATHPRPACSGNRNWETPFRPMTPLRMPRLPLLILMAALTTLAAAPSGESVHEQMDFGVKAAKKGLWKEALFRWEKAVKLQPDNPRLLNNLAVAYETAGNFEKADATYRRALEVDPSNRDIKQNFDLFTTYFKQVLARKE